MNGFFSHWAEWGNNHFQRCKLTLMFPTWPHPPRSTTWHPRKSLSSVSWSFFCGEVICDLQSDVTCDCAWSTSFMADDGAFCGVSASISLPNREIDTCCSCCSSCSGFCGMGSVVAVAVVVFFAFLVALEVLLFFLFLPSASPPSPRTGDAPPAPPSPGKSMSSA